MTSYNPVNGYWNASNYDLTETVLRREWGFDGIVMTDWWAKCNCKGEEGNRENLKALVRAHNDLYMVCDSAEEKPHNIFEGLKEGYITRGDLQYCARNILNYILKSPTFKKFADGGCVKPDFGSIDETVLETVSTIENIVSDREYKLDYSKDKKCIFVYETECTGNTLAQYPITLSVGERQSFSLSVSGNGYKKILRSYKIEKEDSTFVFKFPNNIIIKRFPIMQ